MGFYFMAFKKEHTTPHNNFFAEFFGQKKYSIELLRLILPPHLFRAFDWNTLAMEATTFVSTEGRERRTDLILSVQFSWQD